MKKPIQIALASFAITAALIKATPALAQEPVVEAAVSIVRTSDLDLGSEAGRRKLDSRLVIAAREVCGTPSNLALEAKNDARQCREETLAKARAQRDVVLASLGRGASIAVTAGR